MFVLLLACASRDPVWALGTFSAVPDSTSISGTQTWQFFRDDWGSSKKDDAFVCARVLTFTGYVTSPASYEGCPDCVVSYHLDYEEFDTDCEGTIATDEAFRLPAEMAIGDVPADLAGLDPHPGDSRGWYAVFEGVLLEAYGFAWDDALDWGGEPGPPGWNDDGVYTLWPAYAWDLAADGG